MKNITNNSETLDSIIAAQSWDNWQDEETGEPWDICQVLHCKLDWILDWLGDSDPDIEEHRDTIGYIQDILGMLGEKRLRKIID
jgi:hypothetical protein